MPPKKTKGVVSYLYTDPKTDKISLSRIFLTAIVSSLVAGVFTIGIKLADTHYTFREHRLAYAEDIKKGTKDNEIIHSRINKETNAREEEDRDLRKEVSRNQQEILKMFIQIQRDISIIKSCK